MERCVVAASTFNLFSYKDELETQLVFGEIVDAMHPPPPSRVIYKALEQETFIEGDFVPYPGYFSCDQIDVQGHMPFFSNIIPINPTYTPNVVIHTLTAKLMPWNISLPYGTYLQIHADGKVTLPFSKEVFDKSYRATLQQAHCSLSCVRKIPSTVNVRLMLKEAISMLGIPYLYGGRTAFLSESKSMGIDCSGFVNILFRAQGVFLPRNASDMHKYCSEVQSMEELPPGGLIFLKEDGVLNHVMIKISNNQIIHSSLGAGCVNIITKSESFEIIDKVVFLLQTGDSNGKKSWKDFEVFYGVPKGL